MAPDFQLKFDQHSPDVSPEDDEMSVLDDKILEPGSEDFSDNRRSSYDAPYSNSHRGFDWYNYPSNSPSRPQSYPDLHTFPGAPMVNPTGAMFKPDGAQSSVYQQTPWPMQRTESGSLSPTVEYENYAADADRNTTAPFFGGAVGPVGAQPMYPVSYPGVQQFGQSTAMSPESSKGWAMAATDRIKEISAPSSGPTYRSGDVNKKRNARCPIPAERTLSNIDHLISQSTNEDEIKELKQQKRLLRNRQAALDSRQRKKLHTEKLEEEKKHFTATIGDLEEALQTMKIREAELLREKSEWIVTHGQMNQYIEGLHMEKDEIIRVHTLETAELRKKNNILMETVEKLERGVKPVQETIPGDFSGFENMTMEGQPWDDYSMSNGMPLQQECISVSHQQINQQVKAPEKSTGSDSPISWNAFYMCLLFGAFIASNSTSLPGRSLPQLSEEYRAESANVLKAVLASSQGQELTQSHSVSHATVTGPDAATISGMEMAHMSSGQALPSALDQLHNTLAMPTEEQEREQVFSLNVDQYNSLTTFEDDGGFKPQQPSTLQQALATMRDTVAQQSRMHPAASSDVYSRSLMWDRVPEKVIRDFRRMVQDYASPIKEEGIFQA